MYTFEIFTRRLSLRMFKKHYKETNTDISACFFRATNYKMPRKDRVLKEKEKAKKNAAKGTKSITNMFFKSLSPNSTTVGIATTSEQR